MLHLKAELQHHVFLELSQTDNVSMQQVETLTVALKGKIQHHVCWELHKLSQIAHDFLGLRFCHFTVNFTTNQDSRVLLIWVISCNVSNT